MRRLRALFLALTMVVSGLAAIVVVNAPPARAQFDCIGSCGDLVMATTIEPPSHEQYFGGYFRAYGALGDDSASCFFERANCNAPMGDVDVYNQGDRLTSSLATYYDADTSVWGRSNEPPHQWARFQLPASTTSTPGAEDGHHTLRVQYVPGERFYFNSDSHTVDVVVLPSYSDVTLTQTPETTQTGQKTRLKAHVEGVFPGDGATFGGFPHDPTGAVVFFQGSVALDPPLLLDENSDAEGDYMLDPSGSPYVIARYIGDGDFEGADSSSVTHNFVKGYVSIGLSTPSPTSVVGFNFPVTAHVASSIPATGLPTGSVTFRDTTTNVTLGTVNLDGNGDATIQVGGALGQHSIVGTYNGSPAYQPWESTPLLHTVVKGDVNVGVTQNKASTVYGEPFGLSAGVLAVPPATAAPTGSITFTDDGTALGTTQLNSGQTGFAVPPLTVGSHSLSADYSGDSLFNTGQGHVTHVVTKASTTTSLSASVSDPVDVGTPVTFTATVDVVAPGVAAPTGTVQFFEGGVAATGALPVVEGAASFTTPLGGGTHSFTAVYSGDTRIKGSTSAPLVRTVSCARVVTGALASYTAPSDGLTCMMNATVRGAVRVPAGASLFATSSKFYSSLTTTDAAAVMVCGTSVNGAMTISGTQGAVVFGAPATGCVGNTVNGRVQVRNNTGGVQIGGNRFRAPLTCSSNTPPPTNGGSPNTIRRGAGQCATPGF